MNRDIEFDPTLHRYTVDGETYPSVTQILKAVLGIKWQADEWAMGRGSAVHACAAMIARGQEFEFDPIIAPQVDAIRRFFHEVRPQLYKVEYAVASRVYRFAGTLDMLASIDGHMAIVDWKSSSDIDRTSLQCAGYAIALGANDYDVTFMYEVVLKEDGTYSMSKRINLRPYMREFLAVRTVYGIKERMG